MTWRAITGFRLVTAELDRAAAFYEAIGFSLGARQPIAQDEMALLRLGGTGLRQPMMLGTARVDLDSFERTGRPYPDDADAASLCFQHLALVTDDAEAAWHRARHAGATPISRHGPVTLPASSGGVTAVKFRDPDGHPLELLQVPDGAARGWPGRGLLGVDHSAISVSDVVVSRRFYEARGLSVGDGSLNKGMTQTDLDGLDGVEVDVVPLRPPTATPHLELLGYRTAKGRPCAALDANDIAATRIVWMARCGDLVADPDGHWHQLEASGEPPVTPPDRSRAGMSSPQ